MRLKPGAASVLLALITSAVLILSTATTGQPAHAAAATRSVNVWTWNVAGWTMHRGSTTDGLIKVLTDSIRNRDADFVALNELCRQQYTAIQAALRNAGWPQDTNNFSRFIDTNPAACDGNGYGNAIFSQAPLGTASHYPLPDDGRPEKRAMLCVPLQSQAHLRFCTTHITTSSEVINNEAVNVTQLKYVNARMESFNAAGDTALIAGDFNAQPNYGRMNGWYSTTLDSPNNSGNTGRYRELDDADPANCPGYGENTQAEADPAGPCGPGKKIDLIFVRDDKYVGPYSGDSLSISQACGGPCSDHRILIGTVAVTVNT